MRIDGFDAASTAAFSGYRPVNAERFWSTVEWFSRRLHAEVDGLDKIPPGRTLLVMNHAFGWDAMVPMAAIRRATGRPVWALGEHLWWSVPFLRNLAAAVGTVDGTPQNVDALLAHDEIVAVLPGGLREAMKPKQLRYRLLWGKRLGFVRAAVRNGAPLVPVACIGADDVFELVGDAYARGRRWLRRDFPIPRPAWGIPIVHRVKLRYIVGDPIWPARLPDEADEDLVKRLRREVRGALEELIDDALAKRSGVRT